MFLGVDLAWAGRNRTGLAAVDGEGELLDLAVARTDHEIVSWLRPWVAGPCLVAIDAPIVVNNPSGSRPCEAALGRVFRRYDAGAHPCNTGKPELADGTRAGRVAAVLNLDVEPSSRASRRAIEVYPHPATVSLFGLEKTLKYKHKPGRDLSSLQAEALRLVDHLEALGTADVPLHVTASPDWRRVRDTVRGATRKADLKRVEDVLDAVVCAYVGLYSVRRPELTHVFGDGASGYIVTPVTPAIRDLLDKPPA